jgi:GTPase SAR1 family protein
MEYNIAIIGEQASGKTSCVRLLKGLQFEKHYMRTFGPEVHPMDSTKDGRGYIVVWDMPPDNYEKYMHKMNGLIYVTKKRTPPAIDPTMPHVVLSNRNNRMTRETALDAYINIVNLITRDEYSERIRQSHSFVAT